MSNFTAVPLDSLQIHYPPNPPDTKSKAKKKKETKETDSTTINIPSPPSSKLSNLNDSLRVISPNKSFTSLNPVCRICHEDDTNEKLISPCECIGTLAMVHTNCLEKWLSTSNTDRCEICKYAFRTRRKYRPIVEWFFTHQQMHGPHGFFGDVLCLLLLTPLCLISLYLCGVGAFNYFKHGIFEGAGLAALCLFLFATYILWCLVTIRFHLRTLDSWRSNNQVIQLVDYHSSNKKSSPTSIQPFDKKQEPPPPQTNLSLFI
uniref:E3 ubiquitin-protein ligase MARCH3 n=1 Tax=Cacopsylla melanoneura TaxID=428564 RepID=A0A8D8WH84_9HEMI